MTAPTDAAASAGDEAAKLAVLIVRDVCEMEPGRLRDPAQEMRVSPNDLEAIVENRLADALSACVAEAEAAGVLGEIAAERRRQIEVRGWTPEHDDTHANSELLLAPWGADFRLSQAVAFPLSDSRARRFLIQAAALIVAEIERRDRALAAPEPGR